MKLDRWIIYTVSVAALPFFIRLLSFSILKNPVGYAVSPIDIIFFGLTLNISNINELNNLNKLIKNSIPFPKDSIIGLSILLTVFLSITLGLVYSSELIDKEIISVATTYVCSILLSISSLIFSWFVVLKIQKCYGTI